MNLSILQAFEKAREIGASDLYLGEEIVPTVRVDGDLEDFPFPVEKISEEAVIEIIPPRKKENWEKGKDVDFSMEINERRYRVNIYRDRKGIQLTCRIIPSSIPTLEELGFPQAVKNLTRLRQGLILVTGPSGSGKSTTLAAMIHEINMNFSRNIITIEDPIEFVHENIKSRIIQRELGRDTFSFHNALKSALREDPDVIMIGELRDRETISLALQAAETGHLVLSTLHIHRAFHTVDRIINVFPPYQQFQIRSMLAEMLKGVISQQLIKREDRKGRIAILEILLWTPALASLIREDKTYRIPSLMQMGKKKFGMKLLEDSLLELVARGIISEATFHSFVQKKGMIRVEE